MRHRFICCSFPGTERGILVDNKHLLGHRNKICDYQRGLQAIVPVQRSNPRLLCLLHWQVDSLPPCHLGTANRGTYIQYLVITYNGKESEK